MWVRLGGEQSENTYVARRNPMDLGPIPDLPGRKGNFVEGPLDSRRGLHIVEEVGAPAQP